MNIRTLKFASGVLSCLFLGSAHAALQGRDLDGNTATFEAYYDTVLDITWLGDANFAKTSGYDPDGRMTWQDANTWVSGLSFTDGTRVYDNWRLPTVTPIDGANFNYSFSWDGSTDGGYNVSAPGSKYAHRIGGEMAYLHYNNLGNHGYFAVDGSLSGCYVSSSDTCLDNPGPFQNVQDEIYWTGLEYAPNTVNGWAFGMNDGNQYAGNSKMNTYYAWAVRDGDVAAVPEPESYALFLAGLGLIGFAVRRRMNTGRYLIPHQK